MYVFNLCPNYYKSGILKQPDTHNTSLNVLLSQVVENIYICFMTEKRNNILSSFGSLESNGINH
jgi:hypothetical protein